MSYMNHRTFETNLGIQELDFNELAYVMGGTGDSTPAPSTAPTCTTTGSTTTCTCPAGTRLAAGSDGNVVKMSCVTTS